MDAVPYRELVTNDGADTAKIKISRVGVIIEWRQQHAREHNHLPRS